MGQPHGDAESETRLGSKIFVGGLAFSTTKEQLETLFGEVGTVKDAFLPQDRATGRPRGFGFVEFETEEQAQQAIARFNGYEFLGRTLRVNAAEDRPSGPRSPRPFSPPSFEGGGDRPFGDRPFGGGKPKGSRRNLRARKRSL